MRLMLCQGGNNGPNTHDESLIESKHDDKLDRQELGKWSSANELILRKTIKEKQSIQGDASER